MQKLINGGPPLQSLKLAYHQAFALLLVFRKYVISMLQLRMAMNVAFVGMVLLIIGAHFVAAGETMVCRLQFLTVEHNYPGCFLFSDSYQEIQPATRMAE